MSRPVRLILLALLALLTFFVAACERDDEIPTSAAPATAYDVPFRSDAQLATLLIGTCQRARDAGRPMLIEFSAAWCSDCRRLHEMKQAPPLAEELEAWPKVVVNVGRFDRHRELLASLRVESIAHWEVLAPTRCDAQILDWPSLARRTLEVSSGAARDLSPTDLAGWLAKLRSDYQS